MTDNEIIKALERCADDENYKCNECPLYVDCEKASIAEIALDLINRQKAEIERLQKVVVLLVENQSIPNGAEDEDWFTMPQLKSVELKSVEEVKAEAIKGVAERLKDRVVSKYEYTDVRVFEELDNLVKEMVGDV